ncbi:DUF6493 family protein [Streptomyces sp. NPDC001380]|uniref:DUF7824 domain-containing protein n=1 Tax=Streptomyces sp. NPDC001380 TaxID=3364566 RepID=UPI00367617AA
MTTASLPTPAPSRPAAEGTPQDRLVAAVREGRLDLVRRLLPALGPADRRACLPALKEFRRELRDVWGPDRQSRAATLLVAGTACHSGAAAAAQWIGRAARGGLPEPALPALVEVLADRAPEWRSDVARRLAERPDGAWGWDDYPFVEYLLRTTGTPAPASDAFVARWAGERTRQQVRIRSGRDLWRAVLPAGATLLERLRNDSYLPALAPRLFEAPGTAPVLDPAWHPEGPEGGWPAALARLADEGLLDRSDLLDRCLARLLRGGRPGELRVFLAVLEAFAPTPDEQARRARTYVRLLPDAPSPVAWHAQQVLAGLDEAGRLDPGHLAEASRAVLFRSEKKLVRAQLTWLDRTARRDPARAADVVQAAADALGHEDAAVQERALNLIARHLARAGDGVLPALRAAAEGLDPVHHARSAALLGTDHAAEDGPADLLPPVPVPQPLSPPPATPAEVAEEVSALLAGPADVASFERALDGLVRHARRDRAALAAALEPVLPRETRQRWESWGDCTTADIAFVALAVLGRHSIMSLQEARAGRWRAFGHGLSGFGAVLAARFAEAACQVVRVPPPGLLATPTHSTGALDPAELVRRLRAYEEAGAVPGEVDFSQALLRLTPDAAPEVLAAADSLPSPHGQAVARWLRAGGTTRPAAVPVERPAPRHGQDPWTPVGSLSATRVLLEAAETAAPVPLADPLARLLRPTSHLGGEGNDLWGRVDSSAHWAAVLPGHRETVALRCQRRFAAAADLDQRGNAALLPLLAEAGGPAGEAVHLGVAYGLGARFPEDRTAAVDALLVLAARGDLRPGLLGERLAELTALGAVKPNRLAEALRDASRTGAHGTVWSVLAAALPGLLAGQPPRGAAELLTVAGDCARRSRARGAVPEVTALAARSGSSRLVKEARLLRDALGAG